MDKWGHVTRQPMEAKWLVDPSAYLVPDATERILKSLTADSHEATALSLSFDLLDAVIIPVGGRFPRDILANGKRGNATLAQCLQVAGKHFAETSLVPVEPMGIPT